MNYTVEDYTLDTIPLNRVVTLVTVINNSVIMQQVITKKADIQVVLINPTNNISFSFNSVTDKILDNRYPSEIRKSITEPGITDVNSYNSNYGSSDNIYITNVELVITIPVNSLNSSGNPSIPYFISLNTNL